MRIIIGCQEDVVRVCLNAPRARSEKALSRNCSECVNDCHVAPHRSPQFQVLRIPAALCHSLVPHQIVLRRNLDDEMRSTEADANTQKKFVLPCPQRAKSGAQSLQWNISPTEPADASARPT